MYSPLLFSAGPEHGPFPSRGWAWTPYASDLSSWHHTWRGTLDESFKDIAQLVPAGTDVAVVLTPRDITSREHDIYLTIRCEEPGPGFIPPYTSIYAIYAGTRLAGHLFRDSGEWGEKLRFATSTIGTWFYARANESAHAYRPFTAMGAALIFAVLLETDYRS